MKKEQKTKKKLKVKKLFNIKQNPKSLVFLDFFCYNMNTIIGKERKAFIIYNSYKKHMKNKKAIYFEIMAIILIAIFCISLTPKTLQNDTFYTIKIGEHIIENKGIDMMDPFSWHQNLEYTYPHWLYDVIIYIIYSILGMTGIYISTCFFSAILGITIYKTNSKLVKNRVVSFAIAIGAMYMLRDYIAARAQLVTFILFTLQIYLMEQLANTSKKRYGIGLIVISILIANLHVAVWPFMFVLYLPYIAEYIITIIETKTARKFGKELKNGYKISLTKRDGVKYLIIVMIICMITGFLTPLGTTPYTYLIKTMQGNTTQNINEHLPMTLINCIEILCVLIVFIALLTFTDVKIRLVDLFMFGGLVVLMLYSRRQSTMFVLMCSIILNRLVYDFMKKDGEDIDERLINVFTTLFGGFMLTALIIILSLHFVKGKIKAKYVDEKLYPVEMSKFILQYFDENNIKKEDVRLYNEYNYGSYLLYEGIPVFIDSRCDLYAPEYNGGRDIFMDFINSSNLNTWFEDIFKKYNITHVILYKDSKMNMIIKDAKLDGYNLLKEDDNFVFYEITK